MRSDNDRSRRFFEEGCIAVDMESAAVADVCEERDRVVDLPLHRGPLDGRAPRVKANLERLGRDTFLAARPAAEAAVRG